jgi:hypothetical protein
MEVASAGTAVVVGFEEDTVPAVAPFLAQSCLVGSSAEVSLGTVAAGLCMRNPNAFPTC